MALPKPRFAKEPEPFIPYVQEDKVVDRLRAIVEPYMKRMGFLPNALKLYAHLLHRALLLHAALAQGWPRRGLGAG